MEFNQHYWLNPHYLPPKLYRDTVCDILAIATKRLCKKSKDLVVLDVGSGLGIYSYEFSKKVKQVIGVEPDKNAFKLSVKRNNLTFYNTLIENFDTKLRFDLIVSLTTLEHMPDATDSFKKMFKLLKTRGIMFVTAPNKLWPYEYHYKLWFLNYLPLSLANLYVRIFRRGKSFEDSSHAKTYSGIKKFFNQFPCKYEFFLPNPNASYLGCEQGSKLLRNVGINLIEHFPFMWMFSKGFILVIQKNK